MSKNKYFIGKKKLPVCLLLLFVLTAPSISGNDLSKDDSWETFALGLELIIDNKIDEGILVMEELVSEFPDSAASKKAREYIKHYSEKLDRSGIVSFYLGNMVTATWAASSIPMMLDIENGLVLGTAGIIGVGSGIWSSWLMTRNIDMGLGRDLWIEFIEAASVTNFQYAYMIFGDYIEDSGLRERLNVGGQSITSLVSRGLSYAYILDKEPSSGRVFTVINTYAWSQYYLWIALSGIFNSKNENLNYSLGIIVPDLAAAGSFYLWDKVGWSFQRTGIISVSGLGGLLVGVFTNMIIAEAGNFSPPNAVTSSIILSTSFLGKIIGAQATSKMEPDSKAEKSLFATINFAPLVSQNGTGFMINLSL